MAADNSEDTVLVISHMDYGYGRAHNMFVLGDCIPAPGRGCPIL